MYITEEQVEDINIYFNPLMSFLYSKGSNIFKLYDLIAPYLIAYGDDETNSSTLESVQKMLIKYVDNESMNLPKQLIEFYLFGIIGDQLVSLVGQGKVESVENLMNEFVNNNKELRDLLDQVTA